MAPENGLVVASDHSAPALDPGTPPALTVAPPCTVTFETSDKTFRRLAAGETFEQIGIHNANLVTGPVFVEGASLGDALSVEVLDISIESAWSIWFPKVGPLGSKTDRVHVRSIAIEDGWALLSDQIRVPVEPMIGCIGLAPSEGVSSTGRPAYPWGGNMDLRELSPGRSTIYLPVQVPGALLSVGDLHAAMGGAEPTHVALEAAGRATVRIDVAKGMAIAAPRLRCDDTTIFVGLGETFDEAKQKAVEQAFEFLTTELALSPADAYVYASARLSLRLGGPACSIVLAVVPDL